MSGAQSVSISDPNSRAEVDPLVDHADARGGDVDAVAVAGVDDLGVAGDDADAGAARGTAHRARDDVELRELQPLLEHHAHGEVQRPR